RTIGRDRSLARVEAEALAGAGAATARLASLAIRRGAVVTARDDRAHRVAAVVRVLESLAGDRAALRDRAALARVATGLAADERDGAVGAGGRTLVAGH